MPTCTFAFTHVQPKHAGVKRRRHRKWTNKAQRVTTATRPSILKLERTLLRWLRATQFPAKTTFPFFGAKRSQSRPKKGADTVLLDHQYPDVLANQTDVDERARLPLLAGKKNTAAVATGNGDKIGAQNTRRCRNSVETKCLI